MRSSANRSVHGDYATCKGCGLLFPRSVLNLDGECRDCETYDPRDHDLDEPVERIPLAPEDDA